MYDEYALFTMHSSNIVEEKSGK
jgi:hypothetical protein